MCCGFAFNIKLSLPLNEWPTSNYLCTGRRPPGHKKMSGVPGPPRAAITGLDLTQTIEIIHSLSLDGAARGLGGISR